MTKLNELRGLAGHNEAPERKSTVIIPRKPGKRHNILVDAMLRGSFYGAVLAAIVFLIYSKVDPFMGGVCGVLAAGYAAVFADVNAKALLD